MRLKMFPELLFDHDGWFDETESDLNRLPIALSEDGWADEAERAPAKAPAAGHVAGDLVLYRREGELIPAVLIESTDEGFWLARDSRHGGKSFYLSVESIATRTPQRDFPLDEAA